MGLKGDFGPLHKLLEKLQRAAKGELVEAIKHEMASEIDRLIRDEWRHHAGPSGTPWRGREGMLTLEQSGALKRSLRVEVSPLGVHVRLDGKSVSGRGGKGRHATRSLAGIQQYGGASGSWVPKSVLAERHRQRWKPLPPGATRGLKTYRTAAGWRRGYLTWTRPNPMLPSAGEIPARWMDALQAAAKRAMERWAKG